MQELYHNNPQHNLDQDLDLWPHLLQKAPSPGGLLPEGVSPGMVHLTVDRALPMAWRLDDVLLFWNIQERDQGAAVQYRVVVERIAAYGGDTVYVDADDQVPALIVALEAVKVDQWLCTVHCYLDFALDTQTAIVSAINMRHGANLSVGAPTSEARPETADNIDLVAALPGASDLELDCVRRKRAGQTAVGIGAELNLSAGYIRDILSKLRKRYGDDDGRIIPKW